jgi:hypothetical protein
MMILNYTGRTYQNNVTVLSVLSFCLRYGHNKERKKEPTRASNNGITEISSPYKGKAIPATDVRWAPGHHGMARPQVADGGDALQI